MHSLIAVFESLTFPVIILSCLSGFLLGCCIYGTRYAYKVGVRHGYEFASAPLNPEYNEASKVLNKNAWDEWHNLNKSKPIPKSMFDTEVVDIEPSDIKRDFPETQYEEILPNIQMPVGLSTVAIANKQPVYKEKKKKLHPLILINTLGGFNKQPVDKQKERVLNALFVICTRRPNEETS